MHATGLVGQDRVVLRRGVGELERRRCRHALPVDQDKVQTMQ